MSDSKPRVRYLSERGLSMIADASDICVYIIARYCCRLYTTHQDLWRRLFSRLTMLSILIRFGLNNYFGLLSMLQFIKCTQSFAHSNCEVRDATKTLIVNIQRLLGSSAVESVLNDLRSKQRE